MRLTLQDDSIAVISEIKTIANLKGALWSNGELQIIIGPEVSKITGLLKDELSKTDIDKNKETLETGKNKIAADKGVPVWCKFLKSVSAIFGPLIPFLIGVGLLMALEQLLLRTGAVHAPDSPDYNTFDFVLSVLSGTGFKMMGVIAMWSTVRYLGGKTPIAIALALIMVSPIIPENGIHLVDLGTWEILIKPFYSTILVFIVMGIIVATGQKQMEKHFNPVANFILNPFLTLLVGGLLAFFFFGPIMGVVEKAMLDVFNWFMKLPFGIGTLIVGLTWQPLVVLGVHNILFFAATTDLVATGNPSLFLAAAFAAAWGQMGATIGVAIRSRRSVDRSAAIAAALPGIISGPTESCIYAVNLPRWTPFLTGVLAGGIGGWMIGIFDVGLNNLAGLGGIVGFLAYTDKLVAAILIDLFAFALGIAITVLLWREDKNEKILALETTKMFKELEALNVKNDYQTQRLIEIIKKSTSKNKNSKDLITELKALKPELVKLDSSLADDVDKLILNIKENIKEKQFNRSLIAKARTIKTDRQIQLNSVYQELLKYVKNLNKLGMKTRKFDKLFVKKENLQFKLDKILEAKEDKAAALFTKGQKLLKTEDETKNARGKDLIAKSENLSYKDEKIKNLSQKITEIEKEIQTQVSELSKVTNEFYDGIELHVNKIETIKNKNLDDVKARYFNDIHKIEIKESFIKAKDINIVNI